MVGWGVTLLVWQAGNSHSNKWYVAILKRIITGIRQAYPGMEINIRADGGFSCAPFYRLAEDHGLLFCIAVPANNVLKGQIAPLYQTVKEQYAHQKQKHQQFARFTYQAKSWHKAYRCYAKVESTGVGMNTRFFVSNFENQPAGAIYFDFYVKRGEHSENGIKELKNMCFSGRLSTHGFWSDFLRLLISSMAYEMFLLINQEIKKTSNQAAKKWQISTIRTLLLKVGATIKTTKRRVYYRFSKAFVHQSLFKALITA